MGGWKARDVERRSDASPQFGVAGRMAARDLDFSVRWRLGPADEGGDDQRSIGGGADECVNAGAERKIERRQIRSARFARQRVAKYDEPRLVDVQVPTAVSVSQMRPSRP